MLLIVLKGSEMVAQVDNCNFHISLKREAHRVVGAHYGGFDTVREGFPEKVMLELSFDEKVEGTRQRGKERTL